MEDLYFDLGPIAVIKKSQEEECIRALLGFQTNTKEQQAKPLNYTYA